MIDRDGCRGSPCRYYLCSAGGRSGGVVRPSIFTSGGVVVCTSGFVATSKFALRAIPNVPSAMRIATYRSSRILISSFTWRYQVSAWRYQVSV